MATRRILLALIGVLSALIVLGGAGVAALAFFGLGDARGDQLLVLGDDQQLRLLDPRGRAQVIAEDASPDLFRYPTLAPDGERIAYISQDAEGIALHSLHLRTGERTELYRSRENPPLYAAWSPDGQNISFLSNMRAGGLGVHIVAADGSGESALLGTSANSSYFAWQPGGDQILLHIGGSSFQQGKVATYQPGSTTPLHELADPGFFQAPAWSVDGTQFFYVAQPRVSGPPTPDAVESVLTRVAADGSGPQTIVSEKMAAMLFLRAPTTDQIAYVTVSPEGAFGALKLVDPAGGAARTLSQPDQQVPAFFWSPDSAQIAYLSLAESEPGAQRLTWHVVDRESGAVRELASFTPSRAFTALVSFFDAYSMSFDLWSPGGQALVYGTDEGVYVLDIASGEVRRRGDGVLAMWVGPR